MLKKIGLLVACMSIAPFAALAQSTVTTTGGTSGNVPVFTGSATVGSSAITQSGSNVGIGTTSPGNALSVNGVINAGGNYFNVLTYALNGTPTNGIKIQTAIPYTNSVEMPTVVIEGYAFGAAKPIGLMLNWYVFGGNFTGYAVTSFGAYTPTIQLSNEGGYVVIFINDLPYYERFTVRAFGYGMSESPSWFNGWTVVDQAITGTNTVTLPYKNAFGGSVNITGSTTLADASLSGNLTVTGSTTLTGAATFGRFASTVGYSSYTADGLFGATASPSKWITPSNNYGMFGYADAGTGQYVPRMGFFAAAVGSPTNQAASKTSIGLEPLSADFTLRGGAANSEYLRVLNSNGYVGIGTTPTTQLEVNGGIKSTSLTTTTLNASSLVFPGGTQSVPYNPSNPITLNNSATLTPSTNTQPLAVNAGADQVNANMFGAVINLNDTATANSSTAFRYGLEVNYKKSGSANDSGYQHGAGWFASNQSAGTSAVLDNVVSRFGITGGTVTLAQDFVADKGFTSGGTVTTRQGFVVNDLGQTVGTQYGFYSDSLTSGTTANYGVYINGSQPNYFGGNVGIGTAASSSYQLDVAGKVHSASGGFVFPDGSTQTTAYVPGSGGGTSGSYSGSLTVGGNVGIGTTTTPTYPLAISNGLSIGNIVNVNNTAGGEASVLYSSSGQPSWVAGNGAWGLFGDYVVGGGTSWDPKFVIIPSGNVGIGTAAPQAKLEVTDAAKIYNSVGSEFDSNAEIQGTYTSKVIGQGPALGFVAPANTDGSNAWEMARILASPDNTNSSDANGRMYLQTRYANSGSWAWNNNLVLTSSGAVGIGTTSPTATLEVNGNIKLSGTGQIIFPVDGSVQSTAWTGTLTGGDYAESMDITGNRDQYEPGDVLMLDPANPEKVVKATERYSTLVAGVYSTKPGVVGRRQMTPKDSATTEVPMAMVGVVPTKVSAENGPIRTGDLLVSSSTPGYAMKGTDRGSMLGAVIGKAMGSLDSGTGVITALISLQ